MAAWYDDDAFWEALGPHLFRPAERAAAVAEVAALERLVGLAPGQRVLDVPCGPGRHAVELARRGLAVTGVDRTQAFLDEARRQADAAGVRVELVRADMRAFRRDAAFDVALCLSNSFSYFDDPADDRRFVETVRRSLATPGTFVLDLGWLGRELVARSFRAHGRDWQELDDGHLLLQETTVDPLWSRMENRWLLVRGTERREFRFAQRLYGAPELDALLRAGGFARVEVFGSLGGRPYDHRAVALVAVART